MDWKTLIGSLVAEGWTQKQIADDVGCTQACISGLFTGQRGVRVSYEIGTRLVALHRRVFPGASL